MKDQIWLKHLSDKLLKEKINEINNSHIVQVLPDDTFDMVKNEFSLKQETIFGVDIIKFRGACFVKYSTNPKFTI